MKKVVIGFTLGLMFVLCLAAAVPRYLPRAPHPKIYTMPVEPNEPIYEGILMNALYLRQYGNYERTFLFYNIVRNSARLTALERKVAVLAAPPELSVPKVAEPNEPIDPNK